MSCNEKNSLVREGTSLFNRVLAALNTNYAKVDDRGDADIILFAKKYAAYLNYFDASNTIAGDWQALMKMDACVGLAELMKLDTSKNYDYKLLVYKKIRQEANASIDPDVKTKKQFKFLFDFIFSLVKSIDEQYRLVPVELQQADILKSAIASKMAEAVANLILLYEEFKKPAFDLIDSSASELDEENASLDLISSEKFHSTDLHKVWILPGPLPYTITTAIAVPPISKQEQIVWIISHNLFNAQLDNLLKGVAFLATRASEIFGNVIADYPNHQPHYALFLAFVKLFRIAQDDLNRYTQRHLDFYYKDVLQLKNKLPEPDQAHLTFELQKQVSKHLLKKDTLFKGGRDKAGLEIRYALLQDTVLSKAAIEKMHSWQLAGDNKLVKSNRIANSDNGQEAKLSSPDKSWFTFGDVNNKQTTAIGFGIASNLLFLKEGKRIVTVRVNFRNEIPNLTRFSTDCFKARLTGIKGWHDVEVLTTTYLSGRGLKYTFTLEGDEPAIVPYSEKIHQSNLDIDLPLLQIFLLQELANGIPYTVLCNKTLASIDVSVDVEGVRDLVLSHDTGSIDPSKPFKPFGDFPSDDSSFYIGSNEVFQKPLSSLFLDFKWKNKVPYLNPNAFFLRANKWDDANKHAIESNAINFASNPFNKTKINLEPNEPLGIGTIEGFLRIRMADTNFSYTAYLGKVSKQLSDTRFQKESDGAYHLTVGELAVQDEAILTGFSLNYVAGTSIHLTAGTCNNNNTLYHFTPFGYTKVHPDYIVGSATAEMSEHLSILPDIVHKGELFIGIRDTEPGAVINILFQVADGSSNPLLDMETVNWHFLAKNGSWIKFDRNDIVDGTVNFTQTGIVTVTIPKDISSNNTALEKGLYWIKAAVDKNTDAVCKMILVQAQAGLVQLKLDETTGIEFRQTLPASGISKLVTGDAAIKTITQPFDSFGGRIRETDEKFYVRVSERLRHKQRAINIWDYEHIILEEFQSIFKVKCLNHSGFYTRNSEEVFCENFPGHVTIITIPDQKNKTNINSLRPYTSIRLLRTIHDYLAILNSPFVKLHVKNPQFEEIQLDFKVKFHEHMDESFYRQLLDTEIERFLSPWAFDQSKEISFGGKIVKSVLLNFVEERPYVDFVSCFKMNHIIKRKESVHVAELQDVEEATGSTSMSLLVSYFNEKTNLKHRITVVRNGDCP